MRAQKPINFHQEDLASFKSQSPNWAGVWGRNPAPKMWRRVLGTRQCPFMVSLGDEQASLGEREDLRNEAKTGQPELEHG